VAFETILLEERFDGIGERDDSAIGALDRSTLRLNVLCLSV